MKSLSQLELQNLTHHLQGLLLGAQLQEVLTNDRGVALGFQGVVRYWLILDLLPASPLLLIFENFCPFKKAIKGKPVGLFLQSHGRNLQLKSIEMVPGAGRVLLLLLQSRDQQKSCELEIRLIPKQSNLLVKSEGKSIAWEKPLDLTTPPLVDMPVPRDLADIHEQWLAEQKGDQRPAKDPVSQFEKQKTKDLEKKRKALADIQKQIESQEFELWSRAGHELKVHRTLDIGAEFTRLVNRQESLNWNIENCFTKAKQLESKKDGARKRLSLLIQEIADLENKKYSEKPAKNILVDLMKKTEARGRKLNLESGALAYCGKSGADNLALLRQAKAWDYWLHLKDYPGAHAILHRHRDQEVPEEEIQQVAEWVARESLSQKSLQQGFKLTVVMVECRFVRPIKGDKLGRVTYHSERTFSFTLRHD